MVLLTSDHVRSASLGCGQSWSVPREGPVGLAEGKKKTGFWVPLLINSTGAHLSLPTYFLWAQGSSTFWLLTWHPLTEFQFHASSVCLVQGCQLRARGFWAPRRGLLLLPVSKAGPQPSSRTDAGSRLHFVKGPGLGVWWVGSSWLIAFTVALPGNLSWTGAPHCWATHPRQAVGTEQQQPRAHMLTELFFQAAIWLGCLQRT